MSEPVEDRGFQISLKWLLIGISLGGVGLGLLGKLFYYNPNQFRLAIILLTVVAPFLLAVGTIIRQGWRMRRRVLIAWGAMLLAAPFVGFGILGVANHFYGNAPGGLGVVNNTTLIKQRLPKELGTPWIWQELARRAQARSLSKAECADVIQTLAVHMKATRPQGWDKPLTWERDFLSAATQKQLVSQKTILDLCDAFYGSQPKIDRIPRVREGMDQFSISIEFGNTWDSHSRLPIGLVWNPSTVFVDDNPIHFQRDTALGTHWSGTCFGSFAPGDHDLVIEIDCAYVDSNTPVNVRLGALEPFRWPKQHKKWQVKVTDTFHVIGRRVVPLNLTTNAADDPVATQSPHVERIVILPGIGGKHKAILDIATGDQLSIPLSFDVTAKLGEQTFDFGAFFIANWPGHSVSTGEERQIEIGEVDDDVRSADVKLTPNAMHLERFSEVNEIWGKPIVFPNVPVERFDLEEAKP